ncbi:MAG: DUF423 domain-containing protein [Bacteroidota bacterium]|nr:DUF423 domain-containing protein [Bacteroidota bacterium]
MNKLFLVFAAIAGGIAVILGALVTHQLRQRMPENALEVFETGVRYQFYHVFALLATGILSERFPGKWMNRAGSCFIGGTLLFSGSLYMISSLLSVGTSIPMSLGVLTPIGGSLFILGWIFFSVAILKGRSS